MTRTKDYEAERVRTGEWRVTLDVRARKVSVDEAGVETQVPTDDLVEVGVFAAAGDGARRAAVPADASSRPRVNLSACFAVLQHT